MPYFTDPVSGRDYFVAPSTTTLAPRRLTAPATSTTWTTSTTSTSKAPANKPPSTTTSRAKTSTTAAGRCDPDYAGACVPIASDVDCAGGKGNGCE
jgi:hypothetical protein